MQALLQNGDSQGWFEGAQEFAGENWTIPRRISCQAQEFLNRLKPTPLCRF
jgi:hypothetical protein